MAEAALYELVALCGTAAGLLLLGAARVPLAGRSAAVRLAATAGALAPALAPAAVGLPAPVVLPAGLVAAAGLLTLVGGGRVAAWAAAGRRRPGRPGVLAAALAVGGGLLFVGAVARYERARDASDQLDLDVLTRATWKPPLRPADARARTDAGRPVALGAAADPRPAAAVAAAERDALGGADNVGRMIRMGPAADRCNCHGWVFTGGRYWLGAADVEHILADNGYRPVSDPHPGDVVIYRTGGLITHTAVVRAAGGGGPVLIEGKWGWLGVFLHVPEGSWYGREYTYYRSPRPGHLLAGLGGRPE